MKLKFTIILIFTSLLYGCSKDEISINDLNQEETVSANFTTTETIKFENVGIDYFPSSSGALFYLKWDIKNSNISNKFTKITLSGLVSETIYTTSNSGTNYYSIHSTVPSNTHKGEVEVTITIEGTKSKSKLYFNSFPPGYGGGEEFNLTSVPEEVHLNKIITHSSGGPLTGKTYEFKFTWEANSNSLFSDPMTFSIWLKKFPFDSDDYNSPVYATSTINASAGQTSIMVYVPYPDSQNLRSPHYIVLVSPDDNVPLTQNYISEYGSAWIPSSSWYPQMTFKRKRKVGYYVY